MTFQDTDRKLIENDIQLAERQLGFLLPAQLREHYLKWNGGCPEPYLLSDDKVDTVVSEVLPLFSDGSGTAIDSYKTLVTERHIVDRKFFPFAVDGAGDYFFINVDSGKVYFYSSDNEERPMLVAETLTAFWYKLRSEDEA